MSSLFLTSLHMFSSLPSIPSIRFPTLECHVYKIINDFFGHNITVAGLLTGKDLANQLNGKDLGDRLLIPRVTLRSEGDVFLDDTTPEWLAEQLGGIEVVPVESTGNDFVSKVLF